jgi:centrosomal protein CEP41
MQQQQDKENFDAMSIRSESVKSIITTQPNQLSSCTEETKFILLDLREEEDYHQFHIKEAINFPAPNISRDKTFS